MCAHTRRTRFGRFYQSIKETSKKAFQPSKTMVSKISLWTKKFQQCLKPAIRVTRDTSNFGLREFYKTTEEKKKERRNSEKLIIYLIKKEGYMERKWTLRKLLSHFGVCQLLLSHKSSPAKFRVEPSERSRDLCFIPNIPKYSIQGFCWTGWTKRLFLPTKWSRNVKKCQLLVTTEAHYINGRNGDEMTRSQKTLGNLI